MKTMPYKGCLVLGLLLVLPGGFEAVTLADQPIPANILNPKTAAESWNVIRLATENVERLLEEKRPGEVAVQISYCSPALRMLARLAPGGDGRGVNDPRTREALAWVNALAQASKREDLDALKEHYGRFRAVLEELAKRFDPAVVHARILFCPMHPEVIAQEVRAKCGQCGASLVPRRIPYSFIYTRPGQPTIRMRASPEAPLAPGRASRVSLRLEKLDGSPVRPEDLMEMHTERIHVLVQEPGLDDYHHAHPTATETAGTYSFTFTPRKPGPYRVWADVVPVSTGMQELPFADLPSAAPVAARALPRENQFETSAGGFRFRLVTGGGTNGPLTAQQTRTLAVIVADSSGREVTRLEPAMNAFAHLVGFYDDFQTVVHFHPTGGEIRNPNLRGGPALGFLFHPPKEGFLRLFCQVQIDGKTLFAPFSAVVEPFCAPPAATVK
jgi:hypothetical protein